LIISKNKYGDRTFFADHWPDRASNYLPVVDHPADKATVDFIITAPSHYKVVASGYLVEESQLGNGTTITHWKEDVPLAVKVMAFAAAPFAVQLAGFVNNIPVWTWVYSENRKEGFSDYAIATEPMQYYSKLIGPYPYEKLANVQSKTIFGGLENAGCIFYAENSVTGQGRAEGLIAHEIAHQWFGNSVTEKDWHHIWLSEGFATYLTNVYTRMKYGEEKFKEGMRSDRNRVLRSYNRNPEAVIDTTITDLMRLLNASTYQKGGWVLHMLRNEIGDVAFWRGMRLYYERFRDSNALTSDFEKIMEEVSHKDLKRFFYQWLYIPGEPDIKITKSAGQKKGTLKISVEQTQDYLYTFTIGLRLEDSKGKRMVSIPVSGKEASLVVTGDTDLKIVPDPDVKLFFRSIEK
jgi:aminopeptidase N